MINTVSFLAVLIIDHRVVEIINVSRSFPGCWMHEDSSINAHDVLIHPGYAVPPIIFDIFFQFTAPLTIIIYSLKPIINFAAGKNKAILFCMRYYCLESILIVCHSGKDKSRKAFSIALDIMSFVIVFFLPLLFVPGFSLLFSLPLLFVRRLF